jgi:hypothetical protein
MHFAIPVRQWLTGPLREWAQDILRPSTLQATMRLSRRTVAGYWEQLTRNMPGSPRTICAFVMLGAWASGTSRVAVTSPGWWGRMVRTTIRRRVALGTRSGSWLVAVWWRRSCPSQAAS